jgi:hypothetical protein
VEPKFHLWERWSQTKVTQKSTFGKGGAKQKLRKIPPLEKVEPNKSFAPLF